MCDANRGNPQEIYFIRDTLVACRDYTLNEFKRCLGTFYDEENVKRGIGIWDNDCYVGSPKPTYKLFGHTIKFRGIDEISESFPSDFIFFNEVLDQSYPAVIDLLMRCRKLAIMDFNPKYSAHDIFDMEKRKDTVFTNTTYKNNRFAPTSFVKQIEACSPWMLEDMHLPEDQRRPHQENIKTGTVDKYRWMVYGMGLRANKEGLVFPNVTWVDSIPADCDQISYGMDFGKTAQTAIVKCAVRIRQPKSDLFIQKLFYSPTESSDIVNQVLNQLGIGTGETHVWADNNLPGWIADLRQNGKSIFPTVKFAGSREYWITSIKKFNIHMVKDIDLRKEQENFCYRVVDGKQLSETIKAYDHLLSATGYSVVGDFRELLDNAETKT